MVVLVGRRGISCLVADWPNQGETIALDIGKCAISAQCKRKGVANRSLAGTAKTPRTTRTCMAGQVPIMGKEMLAGADAINCVPPVVWSRGSATLPRSGDGVVLVEGRLRRGGERR